VANRQAGRPTDWSIEMEQEAIDYIKTGYNTEYEHSIPSHLGLCEALNISKTTLYRWAQDSEKGFGDILDKCSQKQHNILIGKGLSGDFNSAIAKLVLGKHGYHERTESSGPDGGPIENKWVVEIVSAED
jgi:hypothetical protein